MLSHFHACQVTPEKAQNLLLVLHPGAGLPMNQHAEVALFSFIFARTPLIILSNNEQELVLLNFSLFLVSYLAQERKPKMIVIGSVANITLVIEYR